MERFIDYIEKSLPNRPGDSILFQFKRKTLDEMNEASAVIEKRGLKDRTVREELIISQYPDLSGKYKRFYEKKTEKNRSKRRLIGNAAGSAAFILVLLIAYLALSFLTKDWGHTWVLMVDGILLWIDYLLILGVHKLTSMKGKFRIVARILLGIGVMVFFVAIFLLSMAVLHIPGSWIIVIAGIAAIFLADSVYLAVTEDKLAVLYYLIYVPAFTSMIYIIFSAAGFLPWSPGWILIPLSLLIDAGIISALVIRNKRIARKVAKHWNED